TRDTSSSRETSLRLATAGLAIATFASLVAASATSDAPPVFGDPLAGLTAAQSTAFANGKSEFNSAEEVDEGLGPVFNGRSCVECHSAPAIGGGSDRLEIGRAHV